MKKNISVAILTALLLAQTAVTILSCGAEPENPAANDSKPQTAAGDAVTEPAEEDALTVRQNVSDDLEDTDFGGRRFKILGDDACEDYYLQEKETGDFLDDAIFQRNAAVTERFNITLDAYVVPEDQLVTTLKSSVLASDDEYQLFSGHIILTGEAVCDGLYYNWYDVPHINFDKPWWSDSNKEDLTYKGKTYLAMGDFALTTIASTYCMFYNKQIAQNYDLGDMYELVNDGKWTIDKLSEISKNIYSDINGNGKADKEDLYGMGIWARSAVNTFFWSFGEKIGKQQNDGSIVLDYYNSRSIDIYEKLNSFINKSEGIYSRTEATSEAQEEVMNMFLQNQLLFWPEVVSYAETKLRDFETDYGIIPYPKFDEAQTEYYTMVDGGHEAMAIPASVKDLDFVGTITEALNAESYKRVIPVYYDIVLKTKGTRDETSVAMLDYLFDHRIFDFGYAYGAFGAAFWPQYLIEKKSADISSYYAKNHKTFDKRMEKVFQFFEEE